MTNIAKCINNSINKKRKFYTNEIMRTSRYFDEGNKKCKTNKDKQIMLTRDIATIDNDKINKRQENLKVNLVMIIGFYVMLIYFLVNTLI